MAPMIEDIWARKPGSDTIQLIWDDPTTEPSARVYNAELVDTWLERLRAYYRKPVAVLQQWERHFGEVTSDVKLGYDMKDLKEKAEAMLRFREAAEKLGEYAADLDDKLKAIETWYQAQLGNEVDPQDIVELGKTLEDKE